MSDTPAESQPTDPDDPSGRFPEWMEMWVLPYVKEPVLWPVLIAILGHVVVLFAFAILGVWRSEGVGAAVLSAAFTLGFCGWEIRVHRRPGPIAAWIGLTWLAAAGLAVLSIRTGFL